MNKTKLTVAEKRNIRIDELSQIAKRMFTDHLKLDVELSKNSLKLSL